MTIDIERLRNDLIDYFGTASCYNKFAMIDLIQIEKASSEKIIQIAIDNGFDLNEYELTNERGGNYGKTKKMQL